jgi:hypothetical protein
MRSFGNPLVLFGRLLVHLPAQSNAEFSFQSRRFYGCVTRIMVDLNDSMRSLSDIHN